MVTTLQTLDRGLSALEFISLNPRGVTITNLSNHLGVHRAIAYRLVATLQHRGYVTRTHTGRIRLGVTVSVLAKRYAPQLLSHGRTVLRTLAIETGATSFLSVAEGDECVVVAVEEPPGYGVRVSYQEGFRHPIGRGAAGLAILATRPEQAEDSDAVRTAREQGYCVTEAQLQVGAIGVSVGLSAVPSLAALDVEASMGVVAIGALDIERASVATLAAVEELRNLLAVDRMS